MEKEEGEGEGRCCLLLEPPRLLVWVVGPGAGASGRTASAGHPLARPQGAPQHMRRAPGAPAPGLSGWWPAAAAAAHSTAGACQARCRPMQGCLWLRTVPPHGCDVPGMLPGEGCMLAAALLQALTVSAQLACSISAAPRLQHTTILNHMSYGHPWVLQRGVLAAASGPLDPMPYQFKP